jgi:hypothetical protein
LGENGLPELSTSVSVLEVCDWDELRLDSVAVVDSVFLVDFVLVDLVLVDLVFVDVVLLDFVLVV